ncbi:fumarylacetoacetate hydrolase family protein [Pseudomonas yamanorum]|uniref:Fumarylacetoacetate hydrolase family protein n=1 Tax=Pseudomonas yamanorum TaxID=515393 RepID=A0A7Y8FE95_9PSED|nr:fumarylacetoacetate hydrolase family protein [Pseudomonas yamanorum]NWE77767.1 fumarylacetoacetate hydrolase family protein [Pseudomonas yamanorum]
MKFQLFNYFRNDDAIAPGILVCDVSYDLQSFRAFTANVTLDEILEYWDEAKLWLAELANDISASPQGYDAHQLEPRSLRYAPLLSRPGTIYGAGANYRDHVDAMAKALNMNLCADPKSEGIPPWHFIKASRSSLAAHGQDINFPADTSMLDWEAELAVFIGKRADKVRGDEALLYVAGYSCANDLSARDHLKRPQVDESSPFRFDWIGHKSFNGSCPVGPLLTPADFINSPESLAIKLWRNGELRQDSNTSNHLYTIADQISYISQRVELFPGDIILTGTPAGVGMETQTFIQRGDIFRVWIEGLGTLENKII